MKIRTINGAAEELKALDPGTQITAWTIRKMITDGTLPYSKAGTRYYIDLDILIDLLGGKTA